MVLEEKCTGQRTDQRVSGDIARYLSQLVTKVWNLVQDFLRGWCHQEESRFISYKASFAKLLHTFAMALFLLPIVPVHLWAQVSSRNEQIEEARREKASHLYPEGSSKTERTLLYVQEHEVLERITSGIAGFRVKLGGLVSGGGFALGPEYLRRDLLKGNLVFRTAAQASAKEYQRYDLQVTAPHFARKKLFFDFFSVHHNYPGISYYGPGPRSRRNLRTDFRLEDTAIDGALGLQPVPHFRLGASGGYLFVNVGPGGDLRFQSSDQVFTPAEAPGIDLQTDFVRYGAFAQIDYRDRPGGPRRGGNYVARFDRYVDQRLGLHCFERLNVELEQYIPFFNERRVIALRAKTLLTNPQAGNTVPFYLQPVLGGSEDLRGFRSFRFYDNNLLVVNGEYRWEVFAGLDMALFADGGKVFPRRSQLNLHGLEGDGGIGWRFNVSSNVFLRIDLAFSREGTQIWLKFNNVFGSRIGRSSNYE
jgi:outer membrane protein assembly factor BamA